MDNQQPPVVLQPGVSLRLQAFLIATHGLTAAVVAWMPALPWWGMFPCWLLLGLSLRHYWRLHIRRTHLDAVQTVTFYALDVWRVHTLAGSKFAVLDDSSFFSPSLCVLNLRTQNGKLYKMVLLPDSVSIDTLRRLRVRVKFGEASA